MRKRETIRRALERALTTYGSTPVDPRWLHEAPWIITAMVLAPNYKELLTFTRHEWLGVAALYLAIWLLARLVMLFFEHQREIAERTLANIARSPRGLSVLVRIREEPRFASMPLPGYLDSMVLDAMSKLEERREARLG